MKSSIRLAASLVALLILLLPNTSQATSKSDEVISVAATISVSGGGSAISNNQTGFSTSNFTDFGVSIDHANITKTFVINNAGAENLIITGVTLYDYGNRFNIVSQHSSPVAGANSTSFDVKFAGQVIGIGLARITITTNDPANPTFIFHIRGTSLRCFTCYTLASNDPNVCSGNGTCGDTEVCTCNARYAGPACGTFMEFQGDATSVSASGSIFFSLPRNFLGPVLGTTGVYKWSLYIDSHNPLPAKPTTVQIGIATSNSPYTGSPLGRFGEGWAYEALSGNKATEGTISGYGASFGIQDTITVIFDADANTLEFKKNGVSQGVAFTNVEVGGQDELRPAVNIDCQYCAVSFVAVQ